MSTTTSTPDALSDTVSDALNGADAVAQPEATVAAPSAASSPAKRAGSAKPATAAKKTKPTKPAKPAKSAKAKKPGKAAKPKKANADDAPFDDADEPEDDAGSADGGGGGSGKQLVIVESPAKAKTINKYLGSGYVVMASVGHVRDLPSRNPKGVKSPVPGVDLEDDFKPTYEVSEGKSKVLSELKRTAKRASQIWFATDPDREGEAIAWHVAEELGVKPELAKRVMFAAITKAEIQRAFGNPHPINMDRVNAQQARRVLDRIVGYQVSPLLWKKVARGLSAGRVQSVAVRVIVEREREIRAFIPDESWQISGAFTGAIDRAGALRDAFAQRRAQRTSGPRGQDAPSRKDLDQWLSEQRCLRAELVSVGGEKFELSSAPDGSPAAQAGAAANASAALATPESAERTGAALAERALAIARSAGMIDPKAATRTDPQGKGPARFVRTIGGTIDPSTPYRVESIETKRTTSRPAPPFITSTLQQAGSNRLGFSAKRTMGAAQQLYQGVDIPGEGPVALITYMRTDSTNISGEALTMVRDYIARDFGPKYLPEKPNFFTSSNKDAQEAHEAIRPTSMAYPPERVRAALPQDLLRVYEMIWERFVACQMTNAQWDSTSVLIVGGRDPKLPLTFRASGRTLVFDGFFKVTGVPGAGEEQMLPALEERQPMAPIALDPEQKFSSPPARYTEASLIKTMEAEGIGRPSTYASIISVIQDRKYVEQLERRFYATDLGEAVTDKLIEAFPDLLDVGYTREMETQLDKVEDEHLDWVQMLRNFYGPFRTRLETVEHTLTHAKAQITPAPDEYRCEKCQSPMVYRLGKNGRFMSCSTYPTCDYACPCDRQGRPQPVRHTEIACPKCGSPMDRRTGRFGPFLGCSKYGDKSAPCDGILRFDKKGHVISPSQAPLSPEPELPCPKCSAAMYLRPGKYGPWLGCSRFPKCRGRGDFKGLPEAQKALLLSALEAHQAANPIVVVKLLDGTALTGADGKALPTAPRMDREPEAAESLEAVADELGM
jgi:DNA topoisomerase-1